MSTTRIARSRALRLLGLCLLSVTTCMVTHTLLNRRSSATVKPTDSLARQDEQAQRAEERAASRRPYDSYRWIIGITPVSYEKQISLLVDVECWHGPKHFPNILEAERANRLMLCVYSPDDPDRQSKPIKVWQSDAVDAVEGLYQERVPVSIPIQPNAKPYPVTVELVSALPVKHKRLHSDKIEEVPYGFCGESLTVQVK